MTSPLAIPHLPPNCRLLVRGVNWLGDAVMTTPALFRLREACPNAFIGILTPDKLSDLWKDHPAIDAVFTFTSAESGCRVAKRLRHERFDAALVLPNSFRSAWESWCANIPVRIGYAGQLRNVLLTHAIAQRPGRIAMRKRSRQEILRVIQSQNGALSPSSNTLIPTGVAGPDLRSNATTLGCSAHHIYQYLHLAAQLGAVPTAVAPEIRIRQHEVDATIQRLQIPQFPGRRLFALNPGAEYGPAKRWPAERFIAAAREIQLKTGCIWLVLGGKGDLPIASAIEAELARNPAKDQRLAASKGVLNLAGATSLRELCAVLAACDLLLTNDTGPMHVAAAVGTKVVAVFGSTSPVLTQPGVPGQNQHQILASAVPCAPCFLRECPIDFRCMRNLAVEHIVQTVLHAQDSRELR